MSKFHIFATDVTITDIIVKGFSLDDARMLSGKAGLQSGEKVTITDPNLFNQLLQSIPPENFLGSFPGGSAANTLVTLARLSQQLRYNNIHIDFWTAISEQGPNALLYAGDIRRDFCQAGINCLEFEDPNFVGTKSLVIRLHEGDRVVFTCPGDAKRIFNAQADRLPSQLRKASAVLFSGALVQKIGWDLPLKIIENMNINEQELWLTLPTSAIFASENGDEITKLIKKSKFTLGNLGELMASLGASDPITNLQNIMKPGAKAFITNGAHDAYFVSPNEIRTVRPHEVRSAENSLGAGDASFGAFLFGAALRRDERLMDCVRASIELGSVSWMAKTGQFLGCS